MRPMMRMGRFGCLMHWGLQGDSILNSTMERVLMQNVKLKLALAAALGVTAISLLALQSASPLKAREACLSQLGGNRNCENCLPA